MFKEKLLSNNEHTLVQTATSWKQKHGQDTDHYSYDELDGNKEIVARYEVHDSTSMYPPFGRTITYEKYDSEGKLVKEGSLTP